MLPYKDSVMPERSRGYVNSSVIAPSDWAIIFSVGLPLCFFIISAKTEDFVSPVNAKCLFLRGLKSMVTVPYQGGRPRLINVCFQLLAAGLGQFPGPS